MTTREQVIAEARTWIGTPFVHQGRLKGVGVDCIGIVIGVAHELGIFDYDYTDYGMSPDPKMMLAQLRQHLDQIAFRDVQPADILWFRVVEPQHVGVVTEIEPLAMVHSYSRSNVMACIEQPLGGVWVKRIAGCFRYRGLE